MVKRQVKSAIIVNVQRLPLVSTAKRYMHLTAEAVSYLLFVINFLPPADESMVEPIDTSDVRVKSECVLHDWQSELMIEG